ncbi:MAG: hypothetical protein UHO63_10365 [Blautia sp.]|nr:hypothetical protein [Blautia sp.]
MIIDDAYAGLKEKYYEQAQTNTGLLSGVVKGLNEFVKKYDSAKQNMNKEMKELKNNYKPNSKMFDEKRMEIYDTFNDTVAQIREESEAEIQNALQQVSDKMTKTITSVPEGGMNDLNVIRSFAGKLSDDEIMAFLNKYKNCYFAVKTIFESMEDGQAKRLGVEFLSVKNIKDTLALIEKRTLDMIRTYNGSTSYAGNCMLDGSEVQKVNDAFESFVSTYEG